MESKPSVLFFFFVMLVVQYQACPDQSGSTTITVGCYEPVYHHNPPCPHQPPCQPPAFPNQPPCQNPSHTNRKPLYVQANRDQNGSQGTPLSHSIPINTVSQFSCSPSPFGSSGGNEPVFPCYPSMPQNNECPGFGSTGTVDSVLVPNKISYSTNLDGELVSLTYAIPQNKNSNKKCCQCGCNLSGVC